MNEMGLVVFDLISGNHFWLINERLETTNLADDKDTSFGSE